MNVREIARIILHFATFGFSFYCLSSLDLGKIMLNSPDKGTKAQLLLVMMSMALGYLSAQFILAIMYHM
ncbi:MAG: DUF1146 domain-containing protein [Erysipelotrichaceae bacterium]|nr:DUF1146 domain-containing protein [Erysipelotrichaceae bacterium]MBQ4252665.1 DUF1146 domain-containing protein [Erysipelotrichaceae bacterium]